MKLELLLTYVNQTIYKEIMEITYTCGTDLNKTNSYVSSLHASSIKAALFGIFVGRWQHTFPKIGGNILSKDKTGSALLSLTQIKNKVGT